MGVKILELGLNGATGRMGTRLVQLIAADPAVQLACALEHDGHPKLGADAGTLAGIEPLGVPLGKLSDAPTQLDAMIDFSHPSGSLAVARFCAEHAIPLVVGTTGLEPEQRQELERLASRIPLIVSPNMSRGVHLLLKLVAEAARELGQEADIEIVERHHHLKKDSPSGTALRIAEVAADAAKISKVIHGRSGLVGERPRNEIGVHAVRAGDSTGDHTVIFGMLGDTLEISHRTSSRDGFVRGAIDAAKFLAGKPAGLYTMADVFN